MVTILREDKEYQEFFVLDTAKLRATNNVFSIDFNKVHITKGLKGKNLANAFYEVRNKCKSKRINIDKLIINGDRILIDDEAFDTLTSSDIKIRSVWIESKYDISVGRNLEFLLHLLNRVSVLNLDAISVTAPAKLRSIASGINYESIPKSNEPGVLLLDRNANTLFKKVDLSRVDLDRFRTNISVVGTKTRGPLVFPIITNDDYFMDSLDGRTVYLKDDRRIRMSLNYYAHIMHSKLSIKDEFQKLYDLDIRKDAEHVSMISGVLFHDSVVTRTRYAYTRLINKYREYVLVFRNSEHLEVEEYEEEEQEHDNKD